MNLTVIISTYNRFEKLCLTLEALNKQTTLDFKVIVMDDGSRDQTVEKCLGIVNNFKYPIEVYTQKNAGASAAVNHAVSLVKEGLIVLFDDDILPAPSCLQKHLNHHHAQPRSLLSGAAYTDEAAVLSDVERYKVSMEKEWRKISDNGEEALRVNFQNFVITTANMSMNKETFDRIGGFDESLRDGYDYEFGLRALVKNVTLFYDLNIEA
ncbi:MAG: glycosyltransferase family 2 protein, partial [Bacteroidota bacterium]|nr:glycosyltransferase family 2 protein [Bacteroidota bacterium]